jgi:hypothetical protein
VDAQLRAGDGSGGVRDSALSRDYPSLSNDRWKLNQETVDFSAYSGVLANDGHDVSCPYGARGGKRGRWKEFVETTAASSKKMIWIGRVVSAIPVLLMLFSAALKFAKPVKVVEGMVRFGYPESQLFLLGLLESLSCVVYLIPRTAVLGAILMTGYLGGATASNVRIGDPSYIMTVFLGICVWGGLFFRDERVRALIPFRR